MLPMEERNKNRDIQAHSLLCIHKQELLGEIYLSHESSHSNKKRYEREHVRRGRAGVRRWTIELKHIRRIFHAFRSHGLLNKSRLR